MVLIVKPGISNSLAILVLCVLCYSAFFPLKDNSSPLPPQPPHFCKKNTYGIIQIVAIQHLHSRTPPRGSKLLFMILDFDIHAAGLELAIPRVVFQHLNQNTRSHPSLCLGIRMVVIVKPGTSNWLAILVLYVVCYSAFFSLKDNSSPLPPLIFAKIIYLKGLTQRPEIWHVTPQYLPQLRKKQKNRPNWLGVFDMFGKKNSAPIKKLNLLRLEPPSF